MRIPTLQITFASVFAKGKLYAALTEAENIATADIRAHRGKSYTAERRALREALWLAQLAINTINGMRKPEQYLSPGQGQHGSKWRNFKKDPT